MADWVIGTSASCTTGPVAGWASRRTGHLTFVLLVGCKEAHLVGKESAPGRLKLQDWTMTDQRKCKGGHCRTGHNEWLSANYVLHIVLPAERCSLLGYSLCPVLQLMAAYCVAVLL